MRHGVETDRLDAGEVHVWTVSPDSIDDPGLLEAYRELMSPDETLKCRRLHFARHRHICLVTRALVRTVLSKYADVDPGAWTFEHNEHGKPEIAAGRCDLPLRFNLSHTRGLVACAVALRREVGVDVEWLGRTARTIEVADRYFSPTEVRDLHAAPAGEQRDRFFRYWTLKESYIKARGVGLALPLGQFSFHIDSDPIRISFDPDPEDDPKSWRFELFRPSSEHLMAAAVRREDGSDPFFRVRETTPNPDQTPN